jgi:hypothetical protein
MQARIKNRHGYKLRSHHGRLNGFGYAESHFGLEPCLLDEYVNGRGLYCHELGPQRNCE